MNEELKKQMEQMKEEGATKEEVMEHAKEKISAIPVMSEKQKKYILNKLEEDLEEQW